VYLPTGTVTAYLDIEYTARDDFAAVRYQETRSPQFPPNRFVTYDRGWVVATDKTQSPQGPQTLVHATKSIEFADPELNTFPGLACDNGWLDLMIQMAHATRRQPPTKERGQRPAQPVDRPSSSGARPDVIAEWAESAQVLIERNVETFRAALAALADRRTDLDVADDFLALGDAYVDFAGDTARVWRELLHRLAQGGRER
jgi:hypothetical protein